MNDAIPIPLSAPDITDSEIEAVVSVLKGSRLSLGPALKEFESAIAKYAGCAHAVAVNSGTSALHLALLALGIGEGDEVIVPSFTFIAAANVIRHVHATPVFVDIEPRTLNLDPVRVEAAITPRTRAIMVVHTFGIPADMDALSRLAQKNNLRIIEDACEAIGAEFRGTKVGTIGDAGAFAFYPNKQITTGEGGVLVTNNSELAATARALRNQGRRETDDWFQHSELGYNYRISEMNCALGVEQLKRIDAILARREQVAESYRSRLADRTDLILSPSTLPDSRISWFVYVVRLSAEYPQTSRDFVTRQLAAAGIATGRYFAPIHLQPSYRKFAHASANLTVTEAEAPRCIALPFFNRIAESQIDRVCVALIAILDGLKTGLYAKL
jgi:perosamine synthetase